MEQESVKRIPLPTFTDPRGSLTAIELAETIPFPVRRIFYIRDVPSGVARAGHATYSPEAIFCVAGRCRIRLRGGEQDTDILLDSPREGLCLPPLTWRSLFDFSNDCVLLCLSDRPYDKEDYINDFDAYLQLKRQNANEKGSCLI